MNRFPEAQFVGMEDFGARDVTTLDASLLEVDRSQLYIGIFGGRYGSGITEKEYLRARERHLPCHIYWKQGDIGSERESAEQQQMRDALKKRLHADHTVFVFPTTPELVAAVAADLHRFLIERMTPAVRSLRAPHANRVRKFVEEYVGAPGSTVPFGGRTADLAALNRWLSDEHASPYCLLVAPAGRGKSALLVRWSNEVAARGDHVVIFAPVSIRFRTNQEAVASSYLRGRFSEFFAEAFDTVGSRETIDETLDEYLTRPLPENQKLLLVIDGIDEAAGWEAGPHLFPARPAKGVRVVVSARGHLEDLGHGPWRRRLGWDSTEPATVLDLGPLTRDGIEDVLAQTNPPNVLPTQRRALIDELQRLTGGDPLLVRLYFAEIAQGAALESLTSRPPGLEAYLRNWWLDQTSLWQQRGELALFEKTASVVLGLLACALGPLRRDELVQLAADDGLSGANLETVIPSLSRLVLGDGEQLPYTFGHPEFGRYYAHTRLTETERTSFTSRFLDWGRETMYRMERGELPPARVPSHLVSHYGAYLAQHAPQELPRLLTDGWRNAWYVHEGEAYGGFLADVARVARAARDVNERCVADGGLAPMLGVSLRCALYQNSIRNRPARTPCRLFALGVEHGVLTGEQALASVGRLEAPRLRLDGLARLVPHLTGAQQEEAVDEAFAIARSQHGTSFIARLAPFLGNRLGEVLEIARQLDELSLFEFLRVVIPHLPQPLVPQARELVARLDGRAFVQALDLLTDRVAPEERSPFLKAMNDVVFAMPRDGAKVIALCHLGRHRADAVDEALAVAEEILVEERYFDSSGLIISALARQLNQLHWDRAWQLYRSAQKNIENAVRAVVALATRFPEAVAEVRRLAILHGPRGESTKHWMLRNPAWEAILVFHLPPSAREGLGSGHLEALVETAASGDGSLSSWVKQTAFALVSQQPESVALAAVEHAKKIASDEGRALVLEALLPRIPESQRRRVLTEELNRARIRDDMAQLLTLSTLVGHAPREEREALAEMVWDPSRQLPNNGERNAVIAQLAPWLRRERADAAARDAFRRLDEIHHDFSRSDALAALVPCLPSDLHAQAIDRALALLMNSDFAASNALLGIMSVEQRNQAFDAMMERIGFLLSEMRWSLARMVGTAIPFLSDDQLDRVFTVSAAVDEVDQSDVLAAATADRRLSDDRLNEHLRRIRGFASAPAKVRGFSALVHAVTRRRPLGHLGRSARCLWVDTRQRHRSQPSADGRSRGSTRERGSAHREASIRVGRGDCRPHPPHGGFQTAVHREAAR